MSRTRLFVEVCKNIGPDAILIKDERDGWPGLAVVRLPSGKTVKVALHVSNVSPHARRKYEMRFQNPASRKPLSAPRGYMPMLVGVARPTEGLVLIGADGRSRVGRNKRFSLLFHRRLIREGLSLGWAEYTSRKGEAIFGINPGLFPTLVDALSSASTDDVASSASADIADSAFAAGLVDEDKGATRRRARRAAEILVRHHAFGVAVVRAYGGLCAMCGLDFGLVVGAHIYPVRAPDSPDKLWNGLALCHNHHAAFDKHLIWIDPSTRRIQLRRDLLNAAKSNLQIGAFVASTFAQLEKPKKSVTKPRSEMFRKRYKEFPGLYAWAK